MPTPPPPGRVRQIGLLVVGVAVVLLLTAPTWFASGRSEVGGAQIVLAAVLAGAGFWLYRRSSRKG